MFNLARSSQNGTTLSRLICETVFASVLSGFVPELSQEIDRGSGQARIGQEPHRSRAKRVELVLCQCGGVRESLPNVLLVDVWEIGNDLGRCHAVGDQVGNGTWSFTVLIAGRG